MTGRAKRPPRTRRPRPRPRPRPRRARAALPAPRASWAYFFDIDGTLAHIADSPDGARLGPGLRELIEALHRAAGGAVALISGRSIADIDRLVPGLRLPAAGQHGLERRGAAGVVTRHAIPAAALDRARERLRAAVARHRGLLLEDKGFSLALHYRRAPRLAGFAHRLMRAVRASLGPRYGVQAGKRVVELKPADNDKGVAVRAFMAEAPFRGRLPVFIGDDVTDEHGFATVNTLGGHSVKVGPGPTVARWRLRDVEEVRRWLESAQGDAAAAHRAVGAGR